MPRSLRGDPSPLRWLVGVELARHRHAVGLSMAEVSDAVGITKPKLAHMETGRQYQSPTDIALLLRAYGVDRDAIDSLVALTDRADEASWWTGAAKAVPDWFGTYLGLERIADSLFVFEPVVIPGLLQTEDYARAIHDASVLARAPDIERVVALRRARCRRLTEERDPLHVHAVMTEAALRLRVSDAAVHKAQLEHLVAMAQRPNVLLQIVRPEDGYHDVVYGNLWLLDFKEVRSIGYVETVEGAVYLQDSDQVHTCTLVTDQLCRIALDRERSIELIESLATDTTDQETPSWTRRTSPPPSGGSPATAGPTEPVSRWPDSPTA